LACSQVWCRWLIRDFCLLRSMPFFFFTNSRTCSVIAWVRWEPPISQLLCYSTSMIFSI
jgi:hypothetical protein